ncbi:MAG: CoA activase [Deltaproteobacteria bacterium]|nr:CoA activase [Deltaproteobacteria bacterium]
MAERYLGIDLGAETIKLCELERRGERLVWTRRRVVEHHKEPGPVLLAELASWGWDGLAGAAAVGRLGRMVRLARVPTKPALAAGFRFVWGGRPATVVSIGSHGFCVLELRPSGVEVLRENSRCSQGTGNFLRQLVERFDLSVAQASALCEAVTDPAPLSGRCPVILKTDMTHLANKGESRARIMAGLYDAVCENVQVLIKPKLSPPAVALVGGVSRAKRVRENFRRFLGRHGMELLDASGDDGLFLDALGCAVHAAERPERVPSLERLLALPARAHLGRVPALASHLPLVRRLPLPQAPAPKAAGRRLVLGFDIGSTGSKAVALDAATSEVLWESYLSTSGNPVGAAQALMERFAGSPAAAWPVLGVGATGSGREIVGSLLATCYGPERVLVMNEIAAHARGALHFDPRVDTIFEIGGQDAKYIRLAEGRVVDAAMNEACSAGTGSFIEEQGRKFSGISGVEELGEQALCATEGVSLGQHCSVFMAEVIDEAVAAGAPSASVIAGIYDSVVQNYLNRVKGSRSVGQVVFCQGMPFCADALAAAVARQTGSRVIVPPNPGTVGALGICLLAAQGLGAREGPPLAPRLFLEARLDRKDTFVCRAARGCGGAGNRCRIDRISTVVAGKSQRFTWGGGCSLWDRGTGKRKLPDLAPDLFREREALVARLVGRLTAAGGGRKRVALTDEFQLKDLFPFFATFLHELGFDLVYEKSGGQQVLKKGIEEANVPYCAPMQLYHGLLAAMAERRPDYLFAPMLRRMPRAGTERYAVACPVVQSSPDIMRWDLGDRPGVVMLSPVIDFGEGNIESHDLLQSCQKLAASLGITGPAWWEAYEAARQEQERFQASLGELGRRALGFCREHAVVPVVVLGRPYTIYNSVLSSNVPPLLREQGAMAIPIDCYPIDPAVPCIGSVYWGHGQRNLRAAHQIRRSPGVYSVWCSNYSCGPDSFNLHFYAYAMAGKPFAVIETDGHSGDAGTKTRLEAFLHCVREDARAAAAAPRPRERGQIADRAHGLAQIRERAERVLVPRMACGVDAQVLPESDARTLELGRRHTSGKECAPMCITLGSLLQRLGRERDRGRRFAFLMPTAHGPCRFGVYSILHKIALERLGWGERVSLWSPADSDYFEELAAGSTSLLLTGFCAHDALLQALYDARPTERWPGAAEAVFDHYFAALLRQLELSGQGELSLPYALLQVSSGALFGCARLLRQAAAELAAIKAPRLLPTVMVVGEIYVRCDPFANGFVVRELEQRGLRVRFAPFTEWLEYTDYLCRRTGQKSGFGAELSTMVQRRIQNLCHDIMAEALGWPPRTTVPETVHAARPWVREELAGEAVLTLGGPVHEHRAGLIDGVVSVGPLECMPNKIAEAQLFHVGEREGLCSLTLSVNGDPLDPELLDSFAFEVKARFAERRRAALARVVGSRAPGAEAAATRDSGIIGGP